MRNSLFILCILLLTVILIPVELLAQAQDSLNTPEEDQITEKVDSTVVYYFYDNSPFSYDKKIVLDTTLKDFQQYDPLKKDYDIIANTTIVGGPHKNLSFVPQPTPLFSIGQENLFAYLMTPRNIKHYTPFIPYSEVAYTMGSEDENLLRVTLGNQLSERLYIGLDFDVETTMGLFTNQRVSSNQFEINGAFETFDKRYGVYVNYIRNKFKFGENAGLTSDYYYEDTTITDRQILAVNLNYATNTFKDNTFVLNQYLTLGGTPTDTCGKVKLGRLFLNTDFTHSYRIYTDKDTSFYDNFYLDSLQTYDSVNTKEFHTAFGWTNDLGTEDQHLGFRGLVNYNYSEYFDGNKKYFFNYLTPEADVFIRTKLFYSELSAKYRIKMDNNSTINIGNGDLLFNGKINFDIFGKEIFAGADFYNVSPMLKAWHYYSNHFMYDQTLHKQTTLNIYGGMDILGYHAKVEFVNISDYTYFDENVLPKQYSGSIALLKIRVKKRFKLRKFGASVMGLYQSSSNDQYLRVPIFTGRGSIYFTFPLFKGALYVHPGFELTYLTSYYADTYDPALMQFHIQNDKKVDDQIYANFFINFKIKRARIFVAYNHFNTLWGKYNYFLTAHYPQQDAALKFGLSWRFYK
jgi:hypothetical protein